MVQTMCEKFYTLHIQITENILGKYTLEAERIYEYKDVWEVRNAYEKFWSDRFDCDTGKFIKANPYRKVKIEGDLKHIQYHEIRIWENLSLTEAKNKEAELKAQEKQNNDIRKCLPFR